MREKWAIKGGLLTFAATNTNGCYADYWSLETTLSEAHFRKSAARRHRDTSVAMQLTFDQINSLDVLVSLSAAPSREHDYRDVGTVRCDRAHREGPFSLN